MLAKGYIVRLIRRTLSLPSPLRFEAFGSECKTLNSFFTKFHFSIRVIWYSETAARI